MSAESRLSMQLGEAIFSLRAIRRFRPDSISDSDIQDILEAAIHAPNGGNAQPWHFLVLRDPQVRARFARLYHEAWWAKRMDEGIHGPEDIPAGQNTRRSAMRLADEMGQVPVILLLCATAKGSETRTPVVPSAQNLLLAARSLGIGGTITTLHPQCLPGELYPVNLCELIGNIDGN